MAAVPVPASAAWWAFCRVLYREFGVESAPRALLDPRARPGIARAVARTLPTALGKDDRMQQAGAEARHRPDPRNDGEPTTATLTLTHECVATRSARRCATRHSAQEHAISA
ncbi:hypothetical protein [Nocardia sp. NPDC051463]|uniref:hypothetical protein n=1 Tax=Nocardia sp. NPDC051463 TaxID=3154845 RepID=UPI00344D4180